MDEKKSTELVPVSETRAELPPILVGWHTPAVEAQVRSFYISVGEIFERWVYPDRERFLCPRSQEQGNEFSQIAC